MNTSAANGPNNVVVTPGGHVVTPYPLASAAVKKLAPNAGSVMGSEETITLWTPEAGKKFRLVAFRVITSANVTLELLDNATLIDRVRTCAGTSPTEALLPTDGKLSAVAGNALKLFAAAAVTAYWSVLGLEE